MTDLDKAREWADQHRNISDHRLNTGVKAAAEVIQSLPDRWVDVEEVQEVLSRMREDSLLEESLHPHVNALERLLTPKLPTLAGMTPEEREACQWMQAVRRDERCVITRVYANTVMPTVRLLTSDGTTLWVNADEATPLPDLPKLEWPGSGDAQEPTKASLDPQENIDASIEYIKKTASDQQPNSSETPKSSIKPEDVPPNEPWLIEVADGKAIGTRFAGDAFAPWSVASLDGSFAGDYGDNGITLIHKLVSEPPALPEGMRLADHEEYGRVVVAPRANTHGEEFFYRLGEDSLWGASYGYRPTEEFTFLDGDQHV